MLLVNNEGNLSLMSNVCPHQGSLILADQKKSLTCQYHAWSWNDNGTPRGQGTTQVCNSHNLENHPVDTSNHLVFRNLVLPPLPIDLTHLQLVEERLDVVQSKTKNIMELFLDVDHIPVVHPKLYDAIGLSKTESVKWDYFDWGSIQKVYKDCNYSSAYECTLQNNKDEELAAIWIAVYPYTMIEWQPGSLFVTVAMPNGASSNVVVLKYKDTRYSNDNWQMNNNIWETAWGQDVAQAESIVEAGPTTHYEDSKAHYHSYLKRNSWRMV